MARQYFFYEQHKAQSAPMQRWSPLEQSCLARANAARWRCVAPCRSPRREGRRRHTWPDADMARIEGLAPAQAGSGVGFNTVSSGRKVGRWITRRPQRRRFAGGVDGRLSTPAASKKRTRRTSRQTVTSAGRRTRCCPWLRWSWPLGHSSSSAARGDHARPTPEISMQPWPVEAAARQALCHFICLCGS